MRCRAVSMHAGLAGVRRTQLCQARHQRLVAVSPRCSDACVQGRFAPRLMSVYSAVRCWALLPRCWRRESCRGLQLERAVRPGNDRPPTSRRRRLLRILVSACGVAAPAGLSRREFESASVQVFALCVAAVPLVKSDAEGAAAVLFDQVGGLNLRCCAGAGLFAFTRLCAMLGFSASLAVLAFAFFAGRRLLGRGRWFSAVLQQVADVRADSRHLMQGVVQRPACAVQCRNFLPEFTIRCDKFCGCNRAERCICWRVRCEVQDLFVKSLQPCEVRSLTQCYSIAEDCLYSAEPCT